MKLENTWNKMSCVKKNKLKYSDCTAFFHLFKRVRFDFEDIFAEQIMKQMHLLDYLSNTAPVFFQQLEVQNYSPLHIAKNLSYWDYRIKPMTEGEGKTGLNIAHVMQYM